MSSTPTASCSQPRYGSIPEQQDLQLDWHRREVHMLCLAGTIGTGLFVGTKRSLAQDETDIGFEPIWEPDDQDMDAEDEDGEELFETRSEDSASVSNSSAGAINSGGSERGTAGPLPPTSETNDRPPPPPPALAKSKSNWRKKKSRKGKKQNPAPVPIVELSPQQAEEHKVSFPCGAYSRTVHIAATSGAPQGLAEQGNTIHTVHVRDGG